MAASIGPSPEMYLKTVLELAPERGRVPVSAVAGRLGVSPVSASEMIHRLARRRLVDYRRYHGARLTAAGRQVARALIRRHRLWECFLFRELGLAWETVHDLACELEHAAPDAVADALSARLGSPAFCPHGNPIPEPSEAPPEGRGVALTDLAPGETATMLAVFPETTESLTYLAQSGLLPGTTLRLERVEPTDGLRLVRLARSRLAVGPALAKQLRVERSVPSELASKNAAPSDAGA